MLPYRDAAEARRGARRRRHGFGDRRGRCAGAVFVLGQAADPPVRVRAARLHRRRVHDIDRRVGPRLLGAGVRDRPVLQPALGRLRGLDAARVGDLDRDDLPRAARPAGDGLRPAHDRLLLARGPSHLRDRATAQSILAHEYGHHIANSRRNTPWSAEDYGTKRWATHEDVCRKAHDETLFPGDEGEHYKLNSGEVFAESYRVLVEQKLGLPSSPWLAVAPSLQPDATALELLAEDISSPWTGPAVSTRTGSFRPYTGDARTIGFTAPLDGVATLRLGAPAGSAYDVRLFDPSGRRLLAETKPGARTTKTIRYLVCGEHSFELRVVRTRGFGPFTLQISKP